MGCWISLSLSDCCFLWEISMLRSPLHSFMKKHFDKYLCQLIRSLCWTILSEAPSQPIKGKKRKWVPIHMFIELKTVKLPIKISSTLQFNKSTYNFRKKKVKLHFLKLLFFKTKYINNKSTVKLQWRNRKLQIQLNAHYFLGMFWQNIVHKVHVGIKVYIKCGCPTCLW